MILLRGQVESELLGVRSCLDGLCGEILAYGLRNPFRISFDTATGELYAADVGQTAIGEAGLETAESGCLRALRDSDGGAWS